MMNEQETKWNKQLFSDTSNNNNHNDNFQITNMIYKIKKLKKNKKVKFENYKNIETLQNIHDNIEVNNKPIVEGLEGHVSTDDPNFLGLPDEDFDGIDTDSKKNNDDPRVAIVNFIDKIYKKIDEFNYNKAYIFAHAFSGKKPVNNDVLVLKKYIGWFIY